MDQSVFATRNIDRWRSHGCSAARRLRFDCTWWCRARRTQDRDVGTGAIVGQCACRARAGDYERAQRGGGHAERRSGALGAHRLNALNSPSSLIKAENFEKLVSLGTGQLVKREQIVNALISEVGGNAYVSTVSIGGRSLRASLLELLQSVNGQLEALVGSISSATLTDVVRADVTSLNASTRVYGLVEPQVHLELAGGDMLASSTISPARPGRSPLQSRPREART